MQYLTCPIPNDHAYLIPIGDLHIGDKAFGKVGRAKLHGYLNWVLEHDNARIFLMGDILNCASRTSKTSPFESNAEEYQEAVRIFTPVKDRIIGAITGNHESRMEDAFGYNPLSGLCALLGVRYCGYSATVCFKVGQQPRRHGKEHGYYQYYHGFFHHTTGGGGTLGGNLNRVTKLRDLVEGMDFFCGGHNHNLVTGVRTVLEPSISAQRMVERRITFVDCGSYLDWDGSYAEKGMLPPGKLGSPRIRLSGKPDSPISHQDRRRVIGSGKDIHVSI